MIRARMFLVAPAPVARAFNDLTLVWERLCWNIIENGQPVEMIEKQLIYHAERDDEDVVRVANALKRLKSASSRTLPLDEGLAAVLRQRANGRLRNV